MCMMIVNGPALHVVQNLEFFPFKRKDNLTLHAGGSFSSKLLNSWRLDGNVFSRKEGAVKPKVHVTTNGRDTHTQRTTKHNVKNQIESGKAQSGPRFAMEPEMYLCNKVLLSTLQALLCPKSCLWSPSLGKYILTTFCTVDQWMFRLIWLVCYRYMHKHPIPSHSPQVRHAHTRYDEAGNTHANFVKQFVNPFSGWDPIWLSWFCESSTTMNKKVCHNELYNFNAF